MNHQTQAPPTLYINPVMTDSTWAPEAYQIIHWHNPSYLNSLWIGLVFNFYLLPYRVLTELILPLVMGEWRVAIMLGCYLPLTVCRWVGWGVTGMAFGLKLPIETLLEGEILSPAGVIEAMQAGHCDLLIKDWRPSDA